MTDRCGQEHRGQAKEHHGIRDGGNAGLIGKIGGNGGIENGAHRPDTYGDQIGDQQTQYLDESGMLQIPYKCIPNPLFYQSRDQDAYLQDRRDQQAKSWPVNTHTGYGERDQQTSDQPQIIDVQSTVQDARIDACY